MHGPTRGGLKLNQRGSLPKPITEVTSPLSTTPRVVLFPRKNGCLLVILWTNYFLSSSAEMAAKDIKFTTRIIFYSGHFLLALRTLSVKRIWVTYDNISLS